MLARELADLIGLGEDADAPLFPNAPDIWKNGDPDFVAQSFPREIADSDFSLRYARLVLSGCFIRSRSRADAITGSPRRSCTTFKSSCLNLALHKKCRS